MRLAAFFIDRDVLKRSAQVLIGAARQWSVHRAASKGAALSFYTLFSMTPILLLAMVIAGYFFGAEAAQGEIIGKVGATGRATGPHLHWGMKWHDARIDPLLIAGPMPQGR